jgi:hypothetical protein
LRRLIDETLNPDSPECWLAKLIRATRAFQCGAVETERTLAHARAARMPRRRLPWTVETTNLEIGVSALTAAAVPQLELTPRLHASSARAPMESISLSPPALATPEAGKVAAIDPLAERRAESRYRVTCGVVDCAIWSAKAR